MLFAEALHITRGVTAIIGSGGKTSLMYRLAQELQGRVIVCTSTQIFPPKHIPFVQRIEAFEGTVCVGTPCPNGKLGPPEQSFEELAEIADYVLVEADGSKHLPLKAHAPHEPVIPNKATQRITVVGASGLNQPISEVVHRHEIFYDLTQSALATPQAVAACLQTEALGDRIFINQTDTNECAARELAELLPWPVTLGSLQKGEIVCSY